MKRGASVCHAKLCNSRRIQFPYRIRRMAQWEGESLQFLQTCQHPLVNTLLHLRRRERFRFPLPPELPPLAAIFNFNWEIKDGCPVKLSGI